MVFTPKFVPDANITSPAEPQVDPGDSAWHKAVKALQAARFKLQAKSPKSKAESEPQPLLTRQLINLLTSFSLLTPFSL